VNTRKSTALFLLCLDFVLIVVEEDKTGSRMIGREEGVEGRKGRIESVTNESERDRSMLGVVMEGEGKTRRMVK